MKSAGELYNDALNAHFGTQHPSNQWDRLGLERRGRFELAAQTFLKALSTQAAGPTERQPEPREAHEKLGEDE